MARLLGPDMGSRYAYLASGAPAANLTAVVYANSAGTVLADIAAYQPGNPGVPGGPIANSQVTTDANGLLPYFWFPDNTDRVWVSVNGGTITPVDADYNARVDGVAGRSSAKVRWVAPDGDDNLSGLTPASPLATLAAALAALPGGAGTVELLPGVYTLGPSNSFDLDISKVGLRCSGGQAVLTWSSAPSVGYAVRLYSSATFADRYNNWRAALDGIVIRGNINAPFAANAVRIGDAVFDGNAVFGLANGGIEGFTPALRFDANSWRINCRSFHIRAGAGGQALLHNSNVNTGENMTFVDCMFEGSAGVKVINGDWHFFGASFDNCPVIADGDAGIWLYGCHVENPGDTTGGYRMLRCEDTLGLHTAAITAVGTQFILNPAPSVFGWSPFFVADTIPDNGLILAGCYLPQTGTWQPTTNETQRRWVAGNGRAVAIATLGNENFNGAPLSGASNLIYNGDAESATTNGWTSTGTGTFTTTTTVGNFRSGTRGFEIIIAAGQSRSTYQEFPVTPGAKLAVGHWWKTVATGDGAVSTGINYYTRSGQQIGSTFAFDNNAANPGSIRSIGGTVPPGATVARLFFDASSAASGTINVYFDDVVASVM